ncbi:MAG: hypothetical protein QMD23_08290, partial [Candidatus Bathyarchaeia archaeon]|nr:hypothetical protein [Candidatus Bathyarchaeia archaeon]
RNKPFAHHISVLNVFTMGLASLVWSENMPKSPVITIRLLPEASKLSDEELIKEIESEIKKAIY